MVELIEYVVVFAISAGVAGASVMVVNGAIPGLDQVASASKSDQIAGAARIAVVEDRNVTLLLPLAQSEVSCQGGVLTVSVGEVPRQYDLGYPCSFDQAGLDGECNLAFSAPAGGLQLQARC